MHEPSPKTKRPAHRPNKYFTHVEPHLDAIRTSTAKGATRENIANMLGVGLSTLKEHANKFPALSAALRAGDAAAVELCEAALFKRAMGYSHPAVKIVTVSNGHGAGSRVEKIPYTEHFPPDTEACKFFLANRSRGRWKHKVEFDGHEGGFVVKVTDYSRPGHKRVRTTPA